MSNLKLLELIILLTEKVKNIQNLMLPCEDIVLDYQDIDKRILEIRDFIKNDLPTNTKD